MSRFVSVTLFVLGIAHIVFGVLRFKAPLRDALADGFVGRFASPEIRRTAFWFILCGPMIMGIGHLAIRASAVGDLEQLRIIGLYLLATSAVGVAAFPASPLWAPLLLSLPLVAIGQGWIAP